MNILLALFLILSLPLIAHSAITVSWQWASTIHIQEDGFELERSPAGCAQWELIAINPPGIMSVQDNDVPGNCYRARAFAQGQYYPYSNIGIVPALAPTCSASGLNNFVGCYYNNIDFTGLVLTRTDQAINFDWGTGSPDATIGPDTFSVRWEGDFDFAETGTYRFTVSTDDGMRVYLDGTQIIDSWRDQAPTTYTADRLIAAGRHRIMVDYYENGVGAVAKASWALLSTTPSDTTPPTVSIASPSDGATVARRSTVTIRSTFSDNVGVTSVRYLVNGSPLPCAALATSCDWIVPNPPNKNYTIGVEAQDQAGNITGPQITVRSSK
jgi:hypothetical protein